MIIGQATYRFCEILRFPDASGQAVPSIRMTVNCLVEVGKGRRRSRLPFPSLFLAMECHPERSEGSRLEVARLNNKYLAKYENINL
jgi:hypothetical protein